MFTTYHVDNLVGFHDTDDMEKHRLEAPRLHWRPVGALISHGFSTDSDFVLFITLKYMERNIGDKDVGAVHLGAFY